MYVNDTSPSSKVLTQEMTLTYGKDSIITQYKTQVLGNPIALQCRAAALHVLKVHNDTCLMTWDPRVGALGQRFI